MTGPRAGMKHYSEAVKDKAMAKLKFKPHKEVAKELAIPVATIRTWERKRKNA
jgi:hypothetical protein